MTESVRLAKRIAALVPCSRREAELYITGGWVKVDGQVVEEPQFRVTAQKIELHPKAAPVPVVPATLLLHQAAAATPQLPCAKTHAADDPSGLRLLKHHFLHLTQCLPLERGASGLAVFSQDGRVTRKLAADAGSIEQEYVVETAGALSTDGLKLLNHGLDYNGKPLPPAKVSWQNETRLRFALKGVQTGQIAHMFQAVGLQIVSLKRLRIGRISLSKLPAGQWRYLMPSERF
ncbi:rRNA pseudouridine synthase [Ferrigenium sp. UT5]|uniref:rRNA pseudouridine synthase n=1 Tax=Ferrigenium sp. UT5 TaxID=3242105 RepID=UPI00354C91EE